jgi:hypothetical protein
MRNSTEYEEFGMASGLARVRQPMALATGDEKHDTSAHSLYMSSPRAACIVTQVGAHSLLPL